MQARAPDDDDDDDELLLDDDDEDDEELLDEVVDEVLPTSPFDELEELELVPASGTSSNVAMNVQPAAATIASDAKTLRAAVLIYNTRR